MYAQMRKSYSIVFIGPAAGVKPFVVLSSLLDEPIDWNKSLIITDMPKRTSPFLELIAKNALAHHIALDLSLKNDVSKIKQQTPDFLISCGWGTKIVSEAIDAPRIAAINCHSSLLPDYKGASVFQHYWANCEDWMGATIHYMTEKFDEGNIIAQQKMRIYRWDARSTILWRLSEMTAVLLREALLLVSSGYQGVPNSGGRFFYKISSRKLRFYRWYNLLALRLGIPRRITPHKVT